MFIVMKLTLAANKFLEHKIRKAIIELHCYRVKIIIHHPFSSLLR